MFFQKLPKNCTFNNLDSHQISLHFEKKRYHWLYIQTLNMATKKVGIPHAWCCFFALPTLRPLPQNQRTMQGRIKHKDLDVFRDLASLSSIRVRNCDAHDSDQLPGCTAKAGPCWASKSSESCSTADFNKRPACWSPGDTWPCSRRKERPDVVQMFYGWYDCLVDCLQTQGNLVTSPQHRENWWNLWKSVVSKLRNE